MSKTMLAARRALALTQIDLSKLTGINQALLSQIESGRRAPMPYQRQLIFNVLGPIIFINDKKGDLSMKQKTNVPDMPEPKWKDGKPDFSELETNEEQNDLYPGLPTFEMRAKLQDALRNHGFEDCIVVDVYGDVLSYVDRVGNLYEIGFTMTGDTVQLKGGPAQKAEVMSRRLIHNFRYVMKRFNGQGVPEMPTTVEEE
jgi:transcriptional regulator with XRE-family HTH domain